MDGLEPLRLFGFCLTYVFQDFPTDPIRNAQLHQGEKRRRWLDEDFKTEVVKRAAGQASTGSVCRAVGLGGGSKNWATYDLVAYAAASWSS